MSRFIVQIVVAACLTAVSACGVNSPIRVADGATVEGDRTTVNGGVSIGAGCEVRGDCRTVNGRVSVGPGSRVGALHTVNGSVRVGRDVTVTGSVGTVNGSVTLEDDTSVDGDVETVNGALSCAPGTVTGDVSTVNGAITFAGTVVEGEVATANGAIRLRSQARVLGDVVVEGKRRLGGGSRPLEISIAEGSVVEGDVIVRDPKRRVTVILESGGRIAGRVENAQLIDRNPRG